MGNIPDIQHSGSLHQFLTKLHSEHGDVAGFWFGKRYHVSLSKGRLFKHVQTLFDRPTELVEFFEPLVTSKALEYVNGEEGRRRHKILAEAFSEKRGAGLQQDLNKICNDFAE